MELDKMEIMEGDNQLFLDVSVQFYKSMDACFDKAYFIRERADLYLHFAFMVISKFENWIKSQISDFVSMAQNSSTTIYNLLSKIQRIKLINI